MGSRKSGDKDVINISLVAIVFICFIIALDFLTAGIYRFQLVITILISILIIVYLILLTQNYQIHEIFLIHKSGILLSHISVNKNTDTDEEELSSMFLATQMLIKDSFPGTQTKGTGNGVNGPIKELTIGDDKNILVEHGKYVYLASIFSGGCAGALRNKVKRILHSIEEKYGPKLKKWTGDVTKIAGIEKMLSDLLPITK